MPEESEGTREWIVEPPPAAGELSLYMAAGDGVELTDDQQAKLGLLLRSLEAHDAEVTAYNTEGCPWNEAQCVLKCGKMRCAVLNCQLGKAPSVAAPGPTSWNLMGSFTAGSA